MLATGLRRLLGVRIGLMLGKFVPEFALVFVKLLPSSVVAQELLITEIGLPGELILLML